MLEWSELRPLQALAASMFFKYKKLLLCLPRQWGGKTELGVRLLEDITSRPFTSSALFLAKNHKAQKKATREKFKRIFDSEVFQVNTEFIFNKAVPTSCVFMGAVDKDPDGERGGTHSFVHWSEVAFAKLEHGETIQGVFGKVIKPTLSMTGGYVLMESTNNGKNGWYDIWNNYKDFGMARLKVSLSEMVYLGLITPEQYEAEKAEYHPDIFRQEFECEFITFLGKAYGEFNPDIHVEEFDGPKSWQAVSSAIDWGYHPSATCVLFAYSENGEYRVFDEHYAMKERTDETRQGIEARLLAYDIQEIACVADHEQDRIDELNRAGIPCGKAKKTNVLGARLSIKTLFWKNKLKIHPRCKNLIRDLEAACWDDKKDGELDSSQCTWGHFDAEAALRYLIRELGENENKEPDESPSIDSATTREWAMKKGISNDH